MDFLKIIIEFTLTFLVIWLIYYFLIIKKCKKNKQYVPAEVNLILYLYQINYQKIDIYKMTKVVSLITTTILAVIITLMSNFFHNKIIVLIFGTIISVLVAIIVYGYVGKYYKSKENQKRKKQK